jgi:copper transport protein
LAGITVLVGSVAFVAWLWPSGAGDRRARRLVTAAWAATVVATGLSIPLQGAYVAAGTLGDALGLDVVADEMGARTGRAWVVRLLLLAAAAVLLPRLARAASSTGARAASVVGGVALLATISLTGHAVSGDLVPLAFVTDVVHLSAVSVWLGGLAVLVVALLWEGADAPDDEVEAVVGRFSPVAFAAVVAIVASGTVQGWRQVGSYDALLETGYGRLLVLKVALVSAMLVAAAVSRSWVRQRAAPRTAALALSPGPGAMAESPGGARSRLSLLRQSVGVEAGLAIVVLAVTSLLVNAVPGETAAGDGGSGGPFATQITEDDIVLSLDVDPAAVGPVSVHLYLNEPGGAPFLGFEEVTADLTLTERDLGPITLSLVDYGQGHLSAEGAEIPLEGDWDLEVTVRTSDIDQTVFETVVPVT